ncbi:MAG: hypothetical protein ABEH47_06965 [Haloferacaceae archaeon]
MLDDDHPHEPDEFDPEERWGSPEEDLPNVPTAPSPDVDESDVDPELLGLWWRSVALANVALGGVAVGLMVIGFRGMWVPGLAGVGLGLLAAFRLYQYYRTFEERDDLGTVDGAEDGSEAPRRTDDDSSPGRGP